MAHALIVDDNLKNLDILARMLMLEGVTCTTVPSPAQLENALANIKALDVIFLDLEMPVANGYEILAYLKNNPQFAAVPVVACTVHTSEVNTAYQQGFNGFLGKPLDGDRFPQQLARILNHEGVWEAT